MSWVRACFALMLFTTAAHAQSNPGFVQGQVLNANQLNQAFAGKTDYPLTGIPLSALPNALANSVLGGINAGPAVYLTVPTCSASNNALKWTPGAGFGCNALLIQAPGGATNNVQYNTGSGFGGLTDAQLTTRCQLFTTSSGCVPGTPATGINFLRDDGTWQPVTAGAVTSVFGRTGAVTAATNDYNFNQLAGTLALTQMATQAANTLVGNATASIVAPTAIPVPACSASAALALQWVAGTGFQCTTISAAASLVVGTTPISGGTTGNFLTVGAGGVLQQATGTGTTTPGGATTQVQFNNAGAFGGSANLTWVSPVLTIGATGVTGRVSLAGLTSGITTLQAAATASGNLTLPAATDTLVGKATTDTFTNKTFDTAGAGNVLQINGQLITAVTGTGGAPQKVATVGSAITPTAGNCAQWDANLNLISAANPCGTGGSGTPGAPPNSVQFNSAGTFGGDASLIWDNTNKQLVSGGSPIVFDGANSRHQSIQTAGGVWSYSALRYTNDAGSPNIGFGKSRGAINTFGAVQVNDVLGALFFYGSNATSFFNTATIQVQATETYSGTAGGSVMRFFTTPTGTVTETEAMRIQASGGVNIGAPFSDPGAGALVLNKVAAAPQPTPTGSMLQLTSNSDTAISVDTFGTHVPLFIGRSSPGTQATPGATGIPALALLAAFQGAGWTGSAFTTGRAAVNMATSELWTATANGTVIDFITTPNTTTTPVSAMRIQASGGVSIGTAIDPAAKNLIVAGSTFYMGDDGSAPAANALINFGTNTAATGLSVSFATKSSAGNGGFFYFRNNGPTGLPIVSMADAAAGATSGNWWQINNTGVTGSVAMFAVGNDANIGMIFNPKGTGQVTLPSGAGPCLFGANNGTVCLQNSTLNNTSQTIVLAPAEQALNGTGAVTVDLNGGANVFFAMSGNVTSITFNNIKVGMTGNIRFVQDATGNRTIPATLSSTFHCAGAACNFVLSTGANQQDVIPFYCVASNFCVAGAMLKTLF